MSKHNFVVNKSKFSRRSEYNSSTSSNKQSLNALNNKSSAIISTAFQDHIVKQLNLGAVLNPTGASNSLLYQRTTNQHAKLISNVKSKVDTGLKKGKSTSETRIDYSCNE